MEFTQRKDISVVIPLLNEEESLPELCRWIKEVMLKHDFRYEILLIDDGSRDRSWEVIMEIAKENPNVEGIRFNRNYGKSAALHTGFEEAKGEVVITMDADLQDSPDEIPELYRLIKKEGYDLISGWKKERHDPISKTIPSLFFNFVTRKISGIKLHDFNCGLKSYDVQVVKNLELYGEMHRYIPMLAKRHGFDRIGEKVVEHRARKYGNSKFGLERFIFGFLDLLSISFVSKFKKRPMHFFGTMGTLSFFFGIIVALGLIIDKVYKLQYQLYAREVTDQPLFFLALVAVIVGVQLFMAGFVAEMITMNTGKKNDYIISEKISYPRNKVF
ncbi:glycosyltransferase family 2 protein [Catalinimonas niigatensis]|uniref:glycosyltransferase family 2 protein n=1 Tax=Catalinimonas niigatensis TaxID=1397264 RepID=UPI0026652595|nr:glycosyltransferase family 2 protein [Catalinimonas niigatensis]WPP52241.1 glycosyltransferase family 2 protein [Catalinimonas niigatensis]